MGDKSYNDNKDIYLFMDDTIDIGKEPLPKTKEDIEIANSINKNIDKYFKN